MNVFGMGNVMVGIMKIEGIYETVKVALNKKLGGWQNMLKLRQIVKADQVRVLWAVILYLFWFVRFAMP